MSEEIKPLDDGLTTVQIEKNSSRQLARVAAAYRRSKKAQIEYMIATEVEKLEKYKLLPALESMPAIDDVA